jgi:hypothetical protein
MDSVFITWAVGIHQWHDVAFLDLPGAFLHTEINKKFITALRGELFELMCMVNLKLYCKHVFQDKKEIQWSTSSNTNLYGLM